MKSSYHDVINKVQTLVSTYPHLFLSFISRSFPSTSPHILTPFYSLAYPSFKSRILSLIFPSLFSFYLLLSSYSRSPGSTLALVHLLLLGCYILILLVWWLVPWKMICVVSLKAMLPQLGSP